MSEQVIRPESFNERWTVYINAAGEPVQRTPLEMAPREVLMALDWAQAEEDRLEPAGEQARVLLVGVDKGESNPTLRELKAAIDASTAYSDAMTKRANLMARVVSLCPARYRDRPMIKNLPKWWPGGRA